MHWFGERYMHIGERYSVSVIDILESLTDSWYRSLTC